MILNFQTQKQLLDNWCWAAVASSISHKYNNLSSFTQSSLAGELLDSSCVLITEDNAGSAPFVCNQDYSLATALKRTGNYAWTVERALTMTEINNQINSGWPICCQIYWEEYDRSHFITAYGYTGNNIVIGDSQAGVFTLSYAELTNNYRGGRWRRSFGTKPRQ